jgi:gelsolin
MYRVTAAGNRLLVREVAAEATSLVPGDAYILDMGTKIWQFNTKGSVGKERFKAAEFVHSLANERGLTSGGACEVTVYGMFAFK